MSLNSPEKVTSKLLETANRLAKSWPPNEFEVRKLARDAEKLRKVSAADYEMILGVCDTFLTDYAGMKKHFESAIQKSPGLLDPIKNYALSLGYLNYDDEACSLLRDKFGIFQGDIETQSQFVRCLVNAGRFHEANIEFENLKKLGVAAHSTVEELDYIPSLHAGTNGLDDERTAEVVRHFSEYLRKIGANHIGLGHELLSEDETDVNRPGIELHYELSVSPDEAARLDFDGSMYMAEFEFDLEQNGVLVLSISSKNEGTDADRAA